MHSIDNDDWSEREGHEKQHDNSQTMSTMGSRASEVISPKASSILGMPSIKNSKEAPLNPTFVDSCDSFDLNDVNDRSSMISYR